MTTTVCKTCIFLSTISDTVLFGNPCMSSAIAYRWVMQLMFYCHSDWGADYVVVVIILQQVALAIAMRINLFI